jgi:hypothetical protein
VIENKRLVTGIAELIIGCMGFYFVWISFPRKPQSLEIVILFLSLLVLMLWTILGGLVNLAGFFMKRVRNS